MTAWLAALGAIGAATALAAALNLSAAAWRRACSAGRRRRFRRRAVQANESPT